MKKKFWGLQSNWKWYGFAMTLLVTIISADNFVHHSRSLENHVRKRSFLDGYNKRFNYLSLVNTSMNDQLERIPPVSNTTEFNFDKTTEMYYRGNKCPNLLKYHHHAHDINQYDYNYHHHHHHHHHHHRNRHKRSKEKRNSRDKRHDLNLDNQRIEIIKQQILSKLGLSSTPNVTSSARSSKFLLEALSLEKDSLLMDEESTAVSHTTTNVDSEPDDFYGKTSEIIGFAEPGYTINGQKLLEFSWSQDMAAADLNVKSATLWIRLELKPNTPYSIRRLPPNLNFTFWVFQVIASGLRNATYLSGKEFEEHSQLSASLPVTLSSLGWKSFDITRTVKEWYASPTKDRLHLLVDCTGCSDYVTPVLFQNEWEKPFLTIHPDPTVTRRVRRRAIDCSIAKRDQCCKQQFYIRFSDIGWHTWIIAPSGYYANYCRGDCGGYHRTPDTYINPHSFAMEDYKKINQYSLFEPCCAPVRFSSISMIYVTPDNNIIKRDLPRMVVEECGCP